MSFYNKLKDDIDLIIKNEILKNKYKKEFFSMFHVNEPPIDKVLRKVNLIMDEVQKIS